MCYTYHRGSVYLYCSCGKGLLYASINRVCTTNNGSYASYNIYTYDGVYLTTMRVRRGLVCKKYKFDQLLLCSAYNKRGIIGISKHIIQIRVYTRTVGVRGYTRTADFIYTETPHRPCKSHLILLCLQRPPMLLLIVHKNLQLSMTIIKCVPGIMAQGVFKHLLIQLLYLLLVKYCRHV